MEITKHTQSEQNKLLLCELRGDRKNLNSGLELKHKSLLIPLSK